MCIRQVAFRSIKWILWILSIHQTFFLHPRSSNLQSVKWCMCCSGDVDVPQRNRKWFFSRHEEFDSRFNVMTINEFSCNGPEVIFSFLVIPHWVFLWSRVGECNSSDFPWSLSCSSPLSRLSRIKEDVLRRCSPPKISTVPSATGKMNFFTFHWRQHCLCIEPSGVEFRCVHILHFLNVCDHNISFPDSLRVQCIAEKCTWQDFWAELVQSRLVFCRDRVIFDHCSKRCYRSFTWFSKSPFARCLPIRQEILNVSQMAVTFHRITAHHFSSKPDGNNTAYVPSFNLRAALAAIPFVSDRWGIDAQWFHDWFSQDFPNSNEMSVLMTFGFSDGSKNCCKLLVRILRSFRCTQILLYPLSG